MSGQSFIYDCPEGRPASSPAPTVEVLQALADDDNGTTEAATTGDLGIDSVDTTLSAAAGAGAETVAIASVTGVTRGRRYLIANVGGDRELVEVLGVNAGTGQARLRRPLSNTYAIGSTLQGCRISIAVNPTWASDKQKLSDILLDWRSWRTNAAAEPAWDAGFSGYRVRWTYTVDSEPTVSVSFADLVRYASKNLVTPGDVDKRFPGWIDRLGVDYRADQGAAVIAEAFRAVKMDAMGDNQVLRRMRSTEVIGDLVMYRANVLAIEANVFAGAALQPALDAAERAYKQRYNQLIREPKIPVDQTGGGSSAKAKRLPAFRR